MTYKDKESDEFENGTAMLLYILYLYLFWGIFLFFHAIFWTSNIKHVTQKTM